LSHHRPKPLEGDPSFAARVGSADGYAASRILCRTMSATRSPIMIEAALVLPETTAGMTTLSPVGPINWP
jgi:hypothetical protein